jgi:hypothetical protein
MRERYRQFLTRIVTPVQDHAAQEPSASVLDRPLGPEIRRDVLLIRDARLNAIPVRRMLALRTVIAVAQGEQDRLAEVVLEVDTERVRLVHRRPASGNEDQRYEQGEAGRLHSSMMPAVARS